MTESMLVKRISATVTSATGVPIWNPSTGKRIQWKGCALRAFVSTTLAGMTPGGAIYLHDNSELFLPLGVFATATPPAGTDYGFVHLNMTPGDVMNVATASLQVSARPTMTGGTIMVVGFIWGDEITAGT